MDSPYKTLEQLTAELSDLVKQGDWDSAASIAVHLSRAVPPRATSADRAAIEAALQNLAIASEAAEARRKDISKLLTGLSSAGDKN